MSLWQTAGMESGRPEPEWNYWEDRVSGEAEAGLGKDLEESQRQEGLDSCEWAMMIPQLFSCPAWLRAPHPVREGLIA